ncbi:hypothetical protein CONPUDRAFT_110749 [Coniophora puteana RWD-64-598 SS2]|uniref:Uncharacterized protein n=1 Tax=Coniophora puteana (strain RWD-64-598) TaxID=741705 RepID=A0A5M3MB38_CONPW|nr:uncharacterized protein CONPUDRAFT_110749 [Coniophora puteana RWD-64-598 SS2]EIW76094.1 hypothetical protein CONPUDRAFT_110749 [Coniophora puteana RWD-64-598 SS2]
MSDQDTDARPRPVVARQDTQAILSYYHSPAAGGTFSPQPQVDDASPPSHLHLRSYSSTSQSSNYSFVSQEDLDQDVPTTARPLNRDLSTRTNTTSTSPTENEQQHRPARRRPSVPSIGNIDRRRLQVVELDSAESEHAQPSKPEAPEHSLPSAVSDSPSNSIRTRRGLEGRLAGLALVAPPDASPKTYTNLTPPLTAPVEPVHKANTTDSHHRSASEVVSLGKERGQHVRRKSSRDVAIVGTESSSSSRSKRDDHDTEKRSSSTAGGLRPPVFQMPQSRSPSPGASGDDSETARSSYTGRSKTGARQSLVSPIKELPETSSPLRTPAIGESKDIADRVSGPVVVDLAAQSQSSSASSALPGSLSPHSQSTSPPSSSHASASPTTPSPYLYYQPGVHARAGPLPPPPMAILNIDPKLPPPPRPPRLNSPFRRKIDAEASKPAQQTPPSVPPPGVDAPSSGPKSPLSPLGQQPSPFQVDEPVKDTQTCAKRTEDETDENTTAHVREGAFPPSRLTKPASPTSPKEAIKSPTRIGLVKASDTPPPSVVEPPRLHERSRKGSGLDIRHRSRGSDESQTTSSTRSSGAEPSPHTVDSATRTSFAPSVPSKGGGGDADYSEFGVELQGKGRMTNSQWHRKQNSTLPRTPSFASISNRLSVAGSSSGKRSSRTPSPSPNSFWERIAPRQVPPSRKIPCAWPAAMQFADVLDRPSALGRSIGYAEKINELYHYDCGLGDWIVDTKARAANPQSYKRATLRLSKGQGQGPRLPSEFAADHHQPRKASQGSMESEMTFPRRPDAYIATDLRSGPSLEDTPTPLPALPYPALAAVSARSSGGPSRASTLLIPSSSLNKTPGGFFSSLGRKTSVRKDRAVNSPPSHKVLSKQPPRLPPRSVNIVSPPPLPGGPRAPPDRMKRAQTLITTPAYVDRASRRPSLFTANGSGSSDNTRPTSSASFSSQVDRLSTLLPNADRNVLAGYLKRAGQDVLAIGQYLEDEKNGELRRD